MPMRCFLPGCRTGYDSDVARRKKEGKKNLSLFKAPKDPYIFELWKKAIPRADKTLGPKHTVCELHFREEDIESYFETKLFNGNIHRILRASKKLKPDAIPCIFSNVPGHSSFVENRKKMLQKKSVKRKKKLHSSNKETEFKRARISCPDNEPNKNNNSSLKTEKKNVLMEVIVVHSSPEKSSSMQQSRLKKRQNAKKSRNSSFSDSQKHAMSDPESESSTTCTSPVPNRITNNLPRTNMYNRILLEPSAHDKLTQNFIEQNSSIESPVPDTLTENYFRQNTANRTIANSFLPDTRKDKYPDQNACDITVTEYPTNSDNISFQSDDDKTMNDFFSTLPPESNADLYTYNSNGIELNDISSDSDKEEQVSFNFIKANVNMFDTRNSWWRVNLFDDFIVFSRWTPDYTVERRIVITKDLAVKVFLMDRETAIGQNMEMFSVYDIAKLIYRVENLKLCSDIDKKDRNCAGFLQNALICRKHSLCLNCIKRRKERRKKAVKRLKKIDKLYRAS